MLAVIPAPELDDWRELEGVDPWGQHRDDIRTALQTAQFASIMGAKRITGGPFTSGDFLLTFEVPEFNRPEELTEEQQEARVARMGLMLRTWVRGHNTRYLNEHPEEEPDVVRCLFPGCGQPMAAYVEGVPVCADHEARGRREAETGVSEEQPQLPEQAAPEPQGDH